MVISIISFGGEHFFFVYLNKRVDYNLSGLCILVKVEFCFIFFLTLALRTLGSSLSASKLAKVLL